MAKLIPKIEIDEIKHFAEKLVAKALVEQLPNDVVIYHSYPWLRTDRNDRTNEKTLREGETDFLVLWPELGFLVLEVKGGDIDYEPHSRRWFRRLDGGRERDIQDPFDQASRNLHYIQTEIENRAYGGNKLPFAYGYAVVFPQCEYTGAMPPGAEPAIVLSSSALSKIDERIGNAIRQWGREPAPIARSQMDSILKAISPVFQLIPVMYRSIEEQEEKLFRMTEEQLRLLDFLGDRKRAAIAGVAGSGKTILAKAQAEKLAGDGARVLVLCYNKQLASWLVDSFQEALQEQIDVFHFHGLTSALCREAKIRFNPPGNDAAEFWREEAPSLLWDAVEALGNRYEAIIVDEGQDFAASWWEPIELLLDVPDESWFYVFYDPAQNLYNPDGATIPALGEPFPLKRNCRNTRSIANTCGEILRQNIETHPEAPMGQLPEIIVETDRQKSISLINNWIKDWVGNHQINLSQIAILSPFTKKNSLLAYSEQVGRRPLVESLEFWRKGEGILFSTIRSFKGLEADLIILVDVVLPGSMDMFSKADLYVASSRAKHVLKIISMVDEKKLLAAIGDEVDTK